MAKRTISVQGTEIKLINYNKSDFISLTDIARQVNPAQTDVVISNWLRNRNTVEYLGLWEELHNPDFNPIGFEGIRVNTGLNSFSLSTKQWVQETNAIGLQAKAGRYGGTYGHQDIAMEFCSWVSPVFKLYLVKEFQRLKIEEQERDSKALEWNVMRVMTKANHKIHTEAVREYLIPPKIQRTKMEGMYFANESDLLNMALFGMTAKDWRKQNPNLKGNMRDHATKEQLLVLSNLQSLNAKLVKWDCEQEQRLQILNESAIEEMGILVKGSSLRQLPTNLDGDNLLNA